MKLDECSVLRTIVRDSFYEFVREFWPVIVSEPLVENWHIQFLCDELQTIAQNAMARKERAYDWVCNIPPGTSKSTIVSQMFPAWVWTRMPSAQFICVSYAFSLAVKDSLKTRDIVQSDIYQRCFPTIQLREDSNTKGLFVNTKKGFRLSAGVGGAITGHHGHFLLVDDPLNPEQSYSAAELKGVNRWMRTTLPSRRIPKNVAPILLIQQRLSQLDPTGDMLERYEKGKLRHVCLPGEITDDVSPVELRERYVDGLLDPVRLPRPILEELQHELGLYGYSGQILQSPVPLGGGDFDAKRINLMDFAPKLIQEVRAWDKAGTQGGGNYSVGVRMGKDAQRNYWVTDVRRGQWNASRREMEIRKTAEQDGKGVEILIEIEGGSGGKESGESTVRNLAGFHVTTFHPTGDKQARAFPYASQVGNGNVYVLNRGWTSDYLEELRYFPAGKFDDQVDASSSAFNRLALKKKKVGSMW